MFRPLAAYIALRYTRAKRRNHFISFISLISMLGIALGVAVLITVLSVMNGFDYQIHNRIFNMVNQVTISGAEAPISNWQNLAKKVSKTKDVTASAPFVMGQGMASNSGMVHGVMIDGILPSTEAKVSNMNSKMLIGNFGKLKPGKFGIILGQTLANTLAVGVGDKVILITPQSTTTPLGVLPRFRRFTVVGIFKVGGGFGFDSGVVFIHLKDAQALFRTGNTVTGLRLRVKDLYDAPQVTFKLNAGLGMQYIVSNWTEQYGTYFKAIKMEKTMMFLILLLIIAIAVFNLVSSLVMTVTDKQADIAILRTLGASPRTIMHIFVLQGAFVGLIGTIIGVIGGVILALNAPHLVSWLQDMLHTHFISSSVYFINYLPSKLDWHYIVNVSIVSLALSLIATIYPAWRAARIKPAEALRYE